jgi:RNA polymerase sigma-70 factor (ECF subfamily)
LVERPESSDEALMAAYCRGDEAAFRQLFDRYAPRLVRALMRQVNSREDAHELVQQTFLQLHRARHDFREGTPLRPWLFTICMNLKREYFRRKGRRPEAPLELDGRIDPVASPHDPVRAERGRQLKRALQQLPDAQREVIELHWFEGLPFSEVAEVVGASVTAVKVRAHRGYERLRGVLGEGERNQEATAGIPYGKASE